jgi:hypothetical protein
MADAQVEIDSPFECHGLANTAPLVQTIRVAEVRPNPQGGTITMGLYHRMSNTIYTGIGGETGPLGSGVAETHAYRDGLLSQICEDSTGEQSLALMTYEASGTEIALTFACPFSGGSPPWDSYTATDDSLILYGEFGGSGIVSEFALVESWQ